MGTIHRWLRDCLAQISSRWGRSAQDLSQWAITSGQQAERAAELYLRRQGLSTLERNFNTPMGEIDLIMRQGEHLVFIEVKYRQQTDWASALETVTWAKQQRIIKAAKQYLQRHRQHQVLACRFDVLGIDCVDGCNQFKWVQHAFE
ncbi:YraN family protein [Marinicella meishanensis]|uniref:YraN family protein n=1 Tax=Marinicella meishanensis TaxID=2873263 RepID=UPI001CBD88F9|nr:YraN family protein [Marinicella sp. NBU2979]